MSPLLKDLLIKGIMAGTAVKQAKKTTTSAAYYGLAGCLGFVAFVYFTIGFNGWLQESFVPYQASLLTGLAVLALSVVVGGSGYLALNKKKVAKKAGFDHGMFDSIEGMLKGLAGNLEEPIRDNPKAALLMAALAGFAAGDKLGERTH